MSPIKSILIFMGKILLVYILLVALGPKIGLHQLNTTVYGNLSESFFSRIGDKGEITYKEIKGKVEINESDYQLTLLNRDELDRVKKEARLNAVKGETKVKTKVPAKTVFFNFWQYGFLPTALFLALMIATPLGLRRKLKGFLLGFLLVQLFIFVRIYLSLLNHFQQVDFLAIYDWSQASNDRLFYFVDKMLYFGSSLVVVVFIWVIVCSGKKEFELLSQKFGFSS